MGLYMADCLVMVVSRSDKFILSLEPVSTRPAWTSHMYGNVRKILSTILLKSILNCFFFTWKRGTGPKSVLSKFAGFILNRGGHPNGFQSQGAGPPPPPSTRGKVEIIWTRKLPTDYTESQSSELGPPPLGSWGGDTLACGEGGGRQFRRLDRSSGTLYRKLVTPPA